MLIDFDDFVDFLCRVIASELWIFNWNLSPAKDENGERSLSMKFYFFIFLFIILILYIFNLIDIVTETPSEEVKENNTSSVEVIVNRLTLWAENFSSF